MVTKFLSDNEIITVAMNLEEEGEKFYDEASRISRHKESKDIFRRLKGEEREHYKTLKELLEGLPDAASRDYFNITDETASYLNSLIETGVFKSIDKSSMRKMNEVEALEKGVRVERDSVLFYMEARNSSTNPGGREVLSRIIDMEKEHFAALSNRLRIARRLF